MASTVAGDLALGFAGERGDTVRDEATGSLAAFDGELYEPFRTGADAAIEVLTAVLTEGDAYEPPDGAYAAAVWDATRESLFLLTDRWATRPLYVTRIGPVFVAAGELKALLAAGVRPELDLQAWAELLAYRHALDNRTPLAGIRALAPATTLALRAGVEHELVRWRYRVEPEAGDEAELTEEFGRLLGRAVERRLPGRPALALSGGLDSRCVATALRRGGLDGPAVTWGARGSSDIRAARRVAERTGLPHRVHPLDAGYITGGAAECVWLGESRRGSLRPYEFTLRSLRREENVDALLYSLRGDDLARLEAPPAAAPGEAGWAAAVHAARAYFVSDELMEELLQPSFARDLRGRAAGALAGRLAADEGDRQARFQQLRTANLPSPRLIEDHFAVRDPYGDAELGDFLRRLPYELRLGGRLQQVYLRQFPALARVRSPKEGLPPILGGRLERAALRAVKLRRAAGALADTRLPGRLGLGHGPFADIAPGLRSGNGELLNILLEERTLRRGQLRAEPVRRLVNETVRGRIAHIPTLEALLMLELFQRLFVDGEPGSEGL